MAFDTHTLRCHVAFTFPDGLLVGLRCYAYYALPDTFVAVYLTPYVRNHALRYVGCCLFNTISTFDAPVPGYCHTFIYRILLYPHDSYLMPDGSTYGDCSITVDPVVDRLCLDLILVLSHYLRSRLRYSVVVIPFTRGL